MSRTHRKYFESLARAQGKIAGEPVRKTRNQRAAVRDLAKQVRAGSRGDGLALEGDALTLELAGAVLATNNDLLRVGDVSATAYRKSWADRLHDIRLMNLPVWRDWLAVVTYPLVIDVVYCVEHKALMDRDGLVGALKYVIDALHGARFMEDDSPAHVTQILPVQLTARPSSLLIKLRPAPGVYGYTDPGLVERGLGAPIPKICG